MALNHYKEFLRGQNHYDSFMLSGAGHGAAQLLLPARGEGELCIDATCRSRRARTDPAARDRDGSGVRTVRGHFFPGGNTGLPFLAHAGRALRSTSSRVSRRPSSTETDFLRGTEPDGKDRPLRIDLFGLKTFRADGRVDDESLVAPAPASCRR